MLEVHFFSYTHCPELGLADKGKWTMPFNSLAEAKAWASFYHRRCISFMEEGNEIELEWFVAGFFQDQVRLDLDVVSELSPSNLTEEEADALPSGESICWA